ncbi:MAG: hypothetical protein ACXVCN_19810 [Bdellovibrio sp.]
MNDFFNEIEIWLKGVQKIPFGDQIVGEYLLEILFSIGTKWCLKILGPWGLMTASVARKSLWYRGDLVHKCT